MQGANPCPLAQKLGHVGKYVLVIAGNRMISRGGSRGR